MTAWPDGKRFALSFFDDTDRATLENVPRVYALLRDLGYRTTKSVWPLAGTRPPSINGGATLAEPGYLEFVRELQRDGFEIALHNVTYHGSTREEVRRGLDRFAELLGHDPASMANHAEAEDGIYWGAARVSGVRRLLYRAATLRRNRRYFGHVRGSPHFWGDLCRERIRYVRNFTFDGVNTLAACPFMPYFDEERPFVRAWFASSEGSDCPMLVRTLCEAAQDRLAEEGGACIIYTHFAKGFVRGGVLDARFAALLRRAADLGGWLVPVTTLLDHLAARRGGVHPIGARERTRLEWRWLRHKLTTPES